MSDTCDASARSIIDGEHLRLLSIGYYISSGVCAFASLFGLLYAAMGAVILALSSRMPAAPGNQEPPAIVGWIFGCLGLALFAILMTLAFLKFRTARCLRKRRSRLFCMIVGGVSCLEIPYGTALGAATLIVLGRDSVKQLFEGCQDPRTGEDPGAEVR